MTCPLVTVNTALTQDIKHAWNCSGSRRANTRPNVSSDGIPFSKTMNCLSQSSRSWPNMVMSFHVSAPPMMAQMAAVMMSRSLCSVRCLPRGSSSAPKCSASDTPIAFIGTLQRFPPRIPPLPSSRSFLYAVALISFLVDLARIERRFYTAGHILPACWRAGRATTTQDARSRHFKRRSDRLC